MIIQLRSNDFTFPHQPPDSIYKLHSPLILLHHFRKHQGANQHILIFSSVKVKKGRVTGNLFDLKRFEQPFTLFLK